MKAPQPKPLDPGDLPRIAEETIALAKFPMLATIDAVSGRPRVRPVSPVRVDGFTIYVANLRSYGKTADIEKDPEVELCYLAPNHDQVRIEGRAEVVSDESFLDEIFEGNPLLQRYLGSPNNPEFLLYRVRPSRVRFMREWALEYLEVPLK